LQRCIMLYCWSPLLYWSSSAFFRWLSSSLVVGTCCYWHWKCHCCIIQSFWKFVVAFLSLLLVGWFVVVIIIIVASYWLITGNSIVVDSIALDRIGSDRIWLDVIRSGCIWSDQWWWWLCCCW
jgi:hypothetical protein